MNDSASLCGEGQLENEGRLPCFAQGSLQKNTGKSRHYFALTEKRRSTAEGHPVQDGEASFSVHLGGGGAVKQLITELNVFIDRP